MKKFNQKFILGISFIFFFSTSTAFAIIPVVDNASIARLIQQIAEMQKQYDMLKQQYNEAVQIKNSLQGNYGMGLLENGVEAMQERRNIPTTWQEVVDMQKSGQLPGLFEGKKDFYKKLLPTVDSKLISQDPNNRNVIGYQLSTDNTRATFASVETIYDNIEKRMKAVENLTSAIDKTTNAKEATDLNSRIVAETNFINLEMMKVQSLQVNLQATLQNLQNQAMANNAEFFAKPDNNQPSNPSLKRR